MATATAEYSRAFLRWVYSTIPSGGTLLATLESTMFARVEATSQGSVLSSVSANGVSTSWNLPQVIASINPEALATLCEFLIRLHDECKAALIAAGDPAPTDLEIRDAMLAEIIPVKEVYRDYYYLDPNT